WLAFTFLELTFALYGQDAPEIALREMQMFQWPWNALFIIFFLTAYAIPVPMWLFKRVRTNIALMFWTSILVNIGMWLERFLIIVPGLARRTPFVYTWEAYRPSPVEWTIFIWSFAWVTFLMLLFSKFFPLVPLFEQKESQVFTKDVMIGRAKVPAIVREAD
ncbi:MAG: polysulfide reductase NrfD, partial [Chloroflexi bacterium]|nr:polysulfide reductase NrfD [Chloroflexota bacterium]